MWLVVKLGVTPWPSRPVEDEVVATELEPTT
jgi:hypothetical protein